VHIGTKYCNTLLLLFVASACISPAWGQRAESPQIAALQGYIGKWSCEGKFPASGKQIASTIEFTPGFGGAALIKHHDDRPSTGSYHAIETWVYNEKQAHLVAGIVDSGGGVRTFSSDGIHDGSLTWTLQSTDQPAQRFVYAHIDDNHFRLDWMMERPGKGFVVGDTLTCLRVVQ